MKNKRQQKTDWARRSWDPMMQMKWNASIKVYPARKNSPYGVRVFPDGTEEMFATDGQRPTR